METKMDFSISKVLAINIGYILQTPVSWCWNMGWQQSCWWDADKGDTKSLNDWVNFFVNDDND